MRLLVLTSADNVATETLPYPTPALSVPSRSTLVEQMTLDTDIDLQQASSRRSSISQESLDSTTLVLPRRRSPESRRSQSKSFLGRYPPPVPRRSISLPTGLLDRIPEFFTPRLPEAERLYIGGQFGKPNVRYIQQPRFTPLFIRLNNDLSMDRCIVCKESALPSESYCRKHYSEARSEGSLLTNNGSTITNATLIGIPAGQSAQKPTKPATMFARFRARVIRKLAARKETQTQVKAAVLRWNH